MKKLGLLVTMTAFYAVLSYSVIAQPTVNGIDPEAIIERMLAVDANQRDQVRDVVFEAEYIEGDERDEGFVEKVRLNKRIYVKYVDDSAWFHEEFLAYYKDGELKEPKDLAKEAKNRTDKRKKRKTRNISYPMLTPFYPENRESYEVEYLGVTSETVESYICHHFQVKSKVEDDQFINGDYYIEAESFHLVRVDFSPTKLVKKLMFKLKELNMSIVYGPNLDEFWLPLRFDIQGKGKAAFFFGAEFAGTEYYRNPVVNSGISADVFEVDDEK